VLHKELTTSNSSIKMDTQKVVYVKIPEGIPTTNKVNGQKRMLAEKRSTVKWY